MSSKQLGRLERLAREELRKPGDAVRRNVFISFDYADIDDVQLLRGQAKNASSELEFSDRSVREAFPTSHEPTIEKGIREKIERSSVTVCYVTSATASSDWVNWEIAESIRLGKGVVFVHPGTKPPAKLPGAADGYNIKTVPWNHQAMMEAIEAAARSGAPKRRKKN